MLQTLVTKEGVWPNLSTGQVINAWNLTIAFHIELTLDVDVEPSPNALFNRSGPISSDIDFGLIPSDISFPQNFDLDNGFDFTFHGAHDKLDSILRLSPDFTQTAFTSYHNDLMDFNIPSTSPFVAQSHTASNSSSESDGYINPGNLSSRILPQSRTGRGSPGSTGSTDSGSASTIDSCIRQLAHLSIDLHEHEATIPPQSIHDSFLGPEELCRKYPFSVDETFRLTQALVDIYPKFLGSFVKSSPSESSRAINMGIGNFGNGSIGFGKSTVNPESHKRLDSKKLSMDHSAVLLILSCHLRLIEIYEQLFEHMDKCAVEDFGTCATRSTNPEIPLPEVRIGNYVPPPEAAIPMQMLLFIHLASQLNAHAGDLAKKISSEIPLDNPKDRSLQNGQLSLRISQMTAETVKYRANRMQEEISQLRRRMLETGFIA